MIPCARPDNIQEPVISDRLYINEEVCSNSISALYTIRKEIAQLDTLAKTQMNALR